MKLPSCSLSNRIIGTEGSEVADKPALASRVRECSSCSAVVIISSAARGGTSCPCKGHHSIPVAAEVPAIVLTSRQLPGELGKGNKPNNVLFFLILQFSAIYICSSTSWIRKCKTKVQVLHISLQCYWTASNFNYFFIDGSRLQDYAYKYLELFFNFKSSDSSNSFKHRCGTFFCSLHFLLNGSGQEDIFSDIIHPVSELP